MSSQSMSSELILESAPSHLLEFLGNLTLKISRSVILTQKYFHVNIFHNNDTAMVSQLFLANVLTVILKLNMSI